MLATFVIAGRISSPPVTVKDEKGNPVSWMLVETERAFRNADGSLGKDQFKVKLWRGIAAECAAVCERGTAVVVHGRLESSGTYANPETEIIAEKVSYFTDLRA